MNTALYRCSILLLLLFTSLHVRAQNVSINTDGSKPDKHAMLDIRSGSKGILIPRITSSARLKIPHTQGLIVYDVNTHSFWYNTGKLWQNLSTVSANISDSAWLLTGNAATIDGTNFVGTTDDVPFNVRVNNQRSGRIDHLLGNSFWGYRSGSSNATGKNNTGAGNGALSQNTTGINNSAFGDHALDLNTTGFDNTAVGRLAMFANTAGNSNTALGTTTLLNQLHLNSQYNTAVGSQVLLGGGGDYNTGVGVLCMWGTNGSYNTGVGYFSLFYNVNGNYNTAVGVNAVRALFPGEYITALGYETFAAGPNSTAIGYGASSGPNMVRLGNTNITVIEGQVPFSTPSDGRFKFNIREDVKGIDLSLPLHAVTTVSLVKTIQQQQQALNLQKEKILQQQRITEELLLKAMNVQQQIDALKKSTEKN